MALVAYSLEQLFIDQDRDWVVDTIAAVLAWVPGTSKTKRRQPFQFEIDHTRGGTTTKEQIDLSWDEAKLERLVPGVKDHSVRPRTKKSAQREHVTELAAYGLTFVAISVLLPGRRVVGMQQGVAPDILFDVTPGAPRGVETAGRAKGGRSAFSAVRNGTASKPGKGTDAHFTAGFGRSASFALVRYPKDQHHGTAKAMTSVVLDMYAANLASSGKLKLRAKGLLASGSPEEVFDACVLLHEAARIERLAVQALPVCPPATLLTSAVVVCWCFVEGLDPPRAADAWGDVLRARDGLDARQADAILERLVRTYPVLQQEFARAIDASATLRAIKNTARLVALAPVERARARKELASILKRFPGATSFHWLAYRLAEADDDKKAAWDALERARKLAPDNPRYRAMSLLVAAWALPTSEAEKHLATVRGSLDRAGAEVCLMYAHAELTLARKGPVKDRKNRWTKARDAADAGIAQALTDGSRMNLKATQLLLQELLANRTPTMDILYRAGLSELAASAKPNAKVEDLLAEDLLNAA